MMIEAIAALSGLIPGWLVTALAAISAAVGTLLVGVFVGKGRAKQAAKIDALQADAQAHERINHAETGIGATDAERIDWLRRYADRNRD